MRFPSLRSIRSTFSAESRSKDKKLRGNDIIEWDGEGGFDVSYQRNERYDSLMKVESGIGNFRKIKSFCRPVSMSISSIAKRPPRCSDEANGTGDYPRNCSHESMSTYQQSNASKDALFEKITLHSQTSSRDIRREVARLVLTSLMSEDDAATGPFQSTLKSSDDADRYDVLIKNIHCDDRYGVPSLPISEIEPDTLHTVISQLDDDSVFDGIIDEAAVNALHLDEENFREPMSRSCSDEDGDATNNVIQYWPAFALEFCTPTMRAPNAFTPISATVMWEDSVLLSALSY
jgi:hypothetical protein